MDDESKTQFRRRLTDQRPEPSALLVTSTQMYDLPLSALADEEGDAMECGERCPRFEME